MMKKIVDFIKDIRVISSAAIAFISIIVVGVLWVHSVSEAVDEATEKGKKYEEISMRQQALMEKIDNKFDVLLELYLKLDDEKVAIIKRLPKKMPIDDKGKPILNEEWLAMSFYDSTVAYSSDTVNYGFPQVGEIFKMVDTGVVLVRTLWDIRKK